MDVPERNGYKWTITEILQLQREYELLNLPLEVIAAKHKRTINAIMQKIIMEDMMCSDDSDYYEDSDEECDEEEEEENYDVIVDNEGNVESVLCIAEKKEPIYPGSPQYTIAAYEYLKNAFIGFLFNTKKQI